MTAGEQPLIRLNVQEDDEIIHVDADGVHVFRFRGEDGIGVGVEDGCDDV